MESSVAALFDLPTVARGELGFYHVAADGAVLQQTGRQEEISFTFAESGLTVELPPDRRCQMRHVIASNEWLAVTFDASAEEFMAPFLESLFMTLAEKEQVELDMESMYSSSLALLEEVSMVGEMLPQLPTGESELDVARMGLEALLVAASVDRAIYLRLDENRALAEVLVEVCAEGTAPTLDEDAIGDQFVVEGDSIVWRAMRGPGSAILESVPPDAYLGRMGSPESHAQRQVIAVPVRYGARDKVVTLGALLVMDKRANTYSQSTQLGSQETKLANSVAAMLGSALGTRKVAELGNEMRMAQMLQQQILPDTAPSVLGFDLAGQCATSGAVGGDYYDFLSLPDGRLLAVIADVSGHNLASGMVMVSARTSLRLLASAVADPGQVFDQLARALFEDLTRTERFITAAGVTIEPGSRRISVVNAGHNPTMIYRAATGEIEEVEGEDTVLGFMPSPNHTVDVVDLEEGDVVLLYTDGITEAVNPDGEMFDESRLREVLKSAAGSTAEDILSAVFGAVGAFADRTEKGDDVSAVVLRVTGAE